MRTSKNFTLGRKVSTIYTGMGKRVIPSLYEFMPRSQRSQEAGFTQPKDHSFVQPCKEKREMEELDDFIFENPFTMVIAGRS